MSRGMIPAETRIRVRTEEGWVKSGMSGIAVAGLESHEGEEDGLALS